MGEKENQCAFCLSSKTDEVLIGEWYKIKNLNLHYYCLLFASCLEQNGADEEGILGFLERDIRKELKRAESISCHYCKRPGATINCVGPKCRIAFHLACGLKNNSFHQFYGRFLSFCKTHRPAIKSNPRGLCHICLEYTKPSEKFNSVCTSCCKDQLWFHRRCISRLALSAGKHYLKCPLCNNNKEFIKQVEYQGVYIPERDAAWEMEPGAYQDLLYRPNKCDISQCKCPKGRKYNQPYTRWDIYICNICGATGAHQLCANIKENSQWVCNECNVIVKDISSSTNTNNEKSESEPEGESSSSPTNPSIQTLPEPTTVMKTEENDVIEIDSDSDTGGELENPTSMLVTQTGVRIPVFRVLETSIEEPPAKRAKQSSGESLSSYHHSTQPSTQIVCIDLTEEIPPQDPPPKIQAHPIQDDDIIILD